MKFLIKVVLLIYMCMQAAMAAHVIVDAGHGGRDPGAVYSLNGVKYLEKDIALDVAKQVQNELKTLGHEVMMTRNDDRFVSLGSRLNTSRQSCKDLFLSIHANAQKPNEPRATGKIVLVDHRLRHRKSYQLARQVQRELNPKRGIQPQGVWVLKNTNPECASILVELGFMSTPSDLQKLANPQYRRESASSIVRAVTPYLKNRDISRKRSKTAATSSTPLAPKQAARKSSEPVTKVAQRQANRWQDGKAIAENKLSKNNNKPSVITKKEVDAKLTPAKAKVGKAMVPLTPQGVKKAEAKTLVEVKKENLIIAKKS